MNKSNEEVERRFLTSEQFTTKQVISMLIPLIFDQLFIYLIMLLTTTMISSSGQDSVTAVSLVTPIHHMSLCLFTAFATGGAVIIAQYKGHGDNEKLKDAIAQTVTLIMTMGFLLSLILCLLARPIVRLLFAGAEESVLSKAELVLAGMAINNFVHALRVSATAGYRGLGDVKANLVGTMLINLSYFVFSFVFLNLLHMDIYGTLLSYFLARFLGMSHSFFNLFINKHSRIYIPFKQVLKPKLSYIKLIFKLGIPFSFEELFFNFGTILVSSFTVVLGTAALAANAIMNSVFQTLFAPTLGVGILATTIIGQCIGAGNKDLARWYGKRLVLLGYIVMGISFVILLLVMKPLIGLFHPSSDALSLIYQLVVIGLIETVLFYPAAFVFPYVLRAAGDAYYSSLTSLLSMWIMRVGFGYLFAIVLGYGMQGIWLMMGAEWLVRLVSYVIRFRGNRWLEKKTIA